MLDHLPKIALVTTCSESRSEVAALTRPHIQEWCMHRASDRLYSEARRDGMGVDLVLRLLLDAAPKCYLNRRRTCLHLLSHHAAFSCLLWRIPAHGAKTLLKERSIATRSTSTPA